jgi:hypothetical protein
LATGGATITVHAANTPIDRAFDTTIGSFHPLDMDNTAMLSTFAESAIRPEQDSREPVHLLRAMHHQVARFGRRSGSLVAPSATRRAP